MTPEIRLRRGISAGVALAVVVAAAAAPAAALADDCPNAAVRAQQQSQHLPSCMAYEKVTPADKGGEAPGPTTILPNGSGIFYSLNAGIEDALSFTAARYRALRGPDGRWTTNALMPAMDGPRLPSLHDAIGDPLAATPDMSRVVVRTSYPMYPNDQGISNAGSNIGTDDIFIREPNGTFTWLVPDPSQVDTSTLHVAFTAAAPDLERVVLQTARRWDPRVTTTNVQHRYVWTPDGTHLATVLPNGDPAASIASSFVSADGRRIAFVVGSGANRRSYVRFNADDPATAYTREVAGAPTGGSPAQAGCVPAASATASPIRGMSRDGTKLVIVCASSTAPGALPAGGYVRDLDGGPDALTPLGCEPDVLTEDLAVGYRFGGGANASVDRIIGGQAERAATTVVAGTGSYNSINASRLSMSVDGEYLAFGTSNDFGLPGIDAGRTDQQQVYLFSAKTGGLTCVSCRQDGGVTEGRGELVATGETFPGGGGGAGKMVTPVSTRGTVTFTTTTALVPEDTNGQADAYAWVDGRAVLLSSGQDPRPSISQGATPDGSSFFFATPDALVGDDRDGGAYDLYVARINGGMLLPDPPPAPCTANCQEPAPPVPGVPNVSTPTFFGPGNLPDATAPTAGTRATASITVPRSVRGTRATVRVRVSRAGQVRVSGVGLRRVTRTVSRAGTYRVTVRLTAHGQRTQRRQGRLATRITARLTPEAGATVQTRRSIRFNAAARGGR